MACGRGFALFAFLFLALFVYVIIAPATARPEFLTNFDKGFYHHSKTENPDGPSAVLGESSNLYAEGDDTRKRTYFPLRLFPFRILDKFLFARPLLTSHRSYGRN